MKRSFVVGSLVGIAVLTLAGFQSQTVHDPFVAMAASGKAKIAVKPAEPDGKCPALCRVTVNGKLAWEKTLPYAFTQTAIADNGLIAGVATAPPKDKISRGDFVIAILDPKGKTLREDHIPITSSPYVDAGFDPKCPGIIFDSENDRLIVRISDYDLNRGQETWRGYQLSNGRRLPDVEPNVPGSLGLMDAAPIKGTDLLATCWYRLDGYSMGLIYALMEPTGRIRWRKDNPGALDNGKTNDERSDLRWKAEEDGTVFPNPSPGSFTFWSPRAAQKLTFHVDIDGDRTTVNAVGEEAYSGLSSKAPEAPPVAPAASIPTEASLTIPTNPSPSSDLTGIQQFYFWGTDKIVFLRSGTPDAICVADLKGKVTRKIPVPNEAQATGTECFLGQTKDSQFLLASSVGQNYGKTRKQAKVHAWNMDVSTSQVTPLPKFEDFGIKALACFPDGRFAVVSTESKPYSSCDHLTLHAPSGEQLWMRGEWGYGGKPEEFLSPEDVAIDEKGQIVLLDNTRQALKLFSASGNFLKNIEFEKVWGREANYPTNVTCLPGGGYWLNDFGSKKPCMLLGPNGKIVRDFALSFPDGKPFEARENIRVDKAGRPWVTDRDGFYRVNEKGVVVARIGTPPRTDVLGEIAALHVALDGRVYTQDGKTRTVFVFDRNGKATVAARPRPSESGDSPAFEITRSGDIFLSRSRKPGIIHFGPDGTRMPDVPDPSQDDKGKQGPFKFKPTWRWRGSRVLDEKNKAVARLRHWPDGGWMLDGPAAMSADNRLMGFADGAQRGRRTKEEPKLAFFAADGTPEGQTSFPLKAFPYLTSAYDGTNAYFATELGVAAVNKTGKVLWTFVPPGWKPDDVDTIFPSLGKLALCNHRGHVVWVDPSKAKPGTVLRKLIPSRSNG